VNIRITSFIPALALLVSGMLSVAAQTTSLPVALSDVQLWNRVQMLPSGAEIMLETRAGAVISGRVQQVTDNTIAVTRYRQVEQLHRWTVARIIAQGKVSFTEAAGPGLTAGARIGFRRGCDYCQGTIKGAAIGAGIGAILSGLTGRGKPKTTLIYETHPATLPVFPIFFPPLP